jgi:DNA-directed RNA polymerase subunit RPC12/RpoP
MPSIKLPANGKCPICGTGIPKARIVKHETKPEALHYYDCPKCEKLVLVKVYDITINPKK